jgi:coatomer subunit beta
MTTPTAAAAAAGSSNSLSYVDRECSLITSYLDNSSSHKESDFLNQLENKDENVKIEGLKNIISALISGEAGNYTRLLMSVIKYCLHTENHYIKKLLLLYWEVVEKRDKQGTLLHEMILVCNAMKNNLTHPNEYIRGCTLRFLCKIKEEQILESLIPSITSNLEHRHSYVRKNAVLTVYSVFSAFPELIPDAPELIETILYNETNPAAKRNAFLMLYSIDIDKAVNFLQTILATINTLGESFQLVILELIRKVCRAQPQSKSQYIRAIFSLVNSTSPAVAFEGANTLIALSSAPTAVRAAVQSYTQLLTKESDNNVKLIILDRLAGLKRRNEKILQENLMDILRILSSPNFDIKKKILELTLELINKQNVNEVVTALKKELVTTQNPDAGPIQSQSAAKTADLYRKLLVETMHQCAVRFPAIVPTVIGLLINYLGDESAAAALDVVYFLREIVEEYSALRTSILQQTLSNFDEIRSADVARVVLWILGEYSTTEPQLLEQTLSQLKQSIGALPLLKSIEKVENNSENHESKAEEDQKSRVQHIEKQKSAKPTAPVVLADGTYASQGPIQSKPVETSQKLSPPAGFHSNLRSLLLSGDFFLASTLCSTITKLVLRYVEIAGLNSPESNEQVAEAILIFVSILRVGTVNNAVKVLDPDSHQRIILCITTLLDPEVRIIQISSIPWISFYIATFFGAVPGFS